MKSDTNRRSKRWTSSDWPGLWPFVLLAVAVAVPSLLRGSEAVRSIARSYRLTSVVPGERVPSWLHSGITYRGVLEPGRQSVRLFAPDSSLSAVVSTSLVTEVQAPTLEQS